MIAGNVVDLQRIVDTAWAGAIAIAIDHPHQSCVPIFVNDDVFSRDFFHRIPAVAAIESKSS